MAISLPPLLPSSSEQFLSACIEGDSALIQQLLDTQPLDALSANSQGTMGYSPFIWAAYEGHDRVVGLLVEVSGINVTAKDDLGRTGLHLAAQNGHLGVLRTFLASDRINPNAKDLLEKTALHLAAAEGKVKVVDLLLSDPRIDPGLLDISGRSAYDVANEETRVLSPLLFAQGRREKDARERQKREERTQREAKELVRAASLVDTAEREVEEEEARTRLKDENAALIGQLDEARAEIAGLRARLDGLQSERNGSPLPKTLQNGSLYPEDSEEEPRGWSRWDGAALGVWFGAGAVWALSSLLRRR